MPSLRTERRKLLARWISSSSRGPTDQVAAICLTWASRPGAGTSSLGQACPGRGSEVLERGEGLDRGDARPPQGLLVGAGHVGQQREVFLLGAPLHAELVVQAAVALEGQAVGDRLERGAGHSAGRGIRAQHQVVGRLEVGFRVGDDFEQGVVEAEDVLGGVPQGLDLGLVLRASDRRAGGRGCRSGPCSWAMPPSLKIRSSMSR